MNKKEKIWSEAAFNAVANNDIDTLRENLDHLMLLKKPSLVKDIFNKFKYLGSQILNGDKNDYGRFIEDLVSTSINNHHSDMTNYLLESDELLVKPRFEYPYIWEHIFAKGEVRNIKYLLKNSKVKEKEIARLITNGMSCIKESNIEVLDMLFDSNLPGYSAFIQSFNKYNRLNSVTAVFNPFISACSQNSIPLVDFYLNKEDIKPFINEQTFYNGFLIAAYNDNSLDVLKHFLNNPNMPIKLEEYDISEKLIYMATLGNATEVLKFLIFDTNIKLDKNLDEILDIENQIAFNKSFGLNVENDNEYKRAVQTTKKLFATRDLKEELQDDLGNSSTAKSKKPKM